MEQVDYTMEEMPRLIYGYKRVLSITRSATVIASPLGLMKHRPSVDISMLAMHIHDHTENGSPTHNVQPVGTAIRTQCSMSMPMKFADPVAAAVVKRENSTKY